MPSASSKPDKPAPVGAEEPIKQVVTIIEKKVRNLEKRKVKFRGEIRRMSRVIRQKLCEIGSLCRDIFVCDAVQ